MQCKITILVHTEFLILTVFKFVSFEVGKLKLMVGYLIQSGGLFLN